MTWEDAPSPCTGGVHHTTSYTTGSDGIVGLNGPQHVTLSPDEAHLYVAALIADAVVVFSRDASTHELSYVETEFDGIGSVDGLDTANGIAVSPDGRQIHVAGYDDDAVATFTRYDLPIFADGFESCNTTRWSLSAIQ